MKLHWRFLLLGPHICFAPFNCFAYDLPNLGDGHIIGLGLQVNHPTKIQLYPERNIWQIKIKAVPLYLALTPNVGDISRIT